MNVQNTFLAVILVLVVGFGGYTFLHSSAQNAMQSGEQVMGDKNMNPEEMMHSTSTSTTNTETADTMAKEQVIMHKESSGAGSVLPMKQSSAYQEYSTEKLSLAASGKVVLFFHATWCPICRALDTELLANLSKIPTDVHILKVDYDTSDVLKKKYGVTYQHTFVQVDAKGDLIAKWGDASTLAEVIAKIK